MAWPHSKRQSSRRAEPGDRVVEGSPRTGGPFEGFRARIPSRDQRHAGVPSSVLTYSMEQCDGADALGPPGPWTYFKTRRRAPDSAGRLTVECGPGPPFWGPAEPPSPANISTSAPACVRERMRGESPRATRSRSWTVATVKDARGWPSRPADADETEDARGGWKTHAALGRGKHWDSERRDSATGLPTTSAPSGSDSRPP